MESFEYKRLTTSGAVKSGAGKLHRVLFSATGSVTAGVVTVYDNTAGSGTIIWSGTIQTGVNPISVAFNCSFATGLYVAYDGTIANVQTTVIYK